MIDQWLICKHRSNSLYTSFDVIDVREVECISDKMVDHLAESLLDLRFNLDFLSAMSEKLGWKNVQESIIKRHIPKQDKARRGEFGEMLINNILSLFHGYHIPVPKLRFKITSGQSLPGTDTLAIRLNKDGKIVEVCFVESKLRTTTAYNAAVEGYMQLKGDYSTRLPDILTFVASQLFERKDPLFGEFAEYLRDRKDMSDRETFNLHLCWESNAWNERVLENLQENGVDLRNMVVQVVCLSDLVDVTNRVFYQVGVVTISDDE